MTGDVIWDFFCGAGGFSLGFAGKDNIIVGIDMNEIAIKTYKHNLSKVFKEVIAITDDVENITPEYLENTRLPKPNILIGSPPCQNFSCANRFKTKDTTLVEKFLEIKDAIEPKWWVMEEVPAVGKIGWEKGWFKPRYLKACEFNLPHVRKRLFAGNYPEPMKRLYTHNKITTIPARNPLYAYKKYKNQFLNGLLKTPIAKMRGYGHGKDDRRKIIEQFKLLKEMLDGGGYIPTIRSRASFGSFDANRKLSGKFTDIVTVELCAWIMGFPSWYEFKGSKTQQYRQIGNAVCPPISRAIYKAILNPPVEMGSLR